MLDIAAWMSIVMIRNSPQSKTHNLGDLMSRRVRRKELNKLLGDLSLSPILEMGLECLGNFFTGLSRPWIDGIFGFGVEFE